METTQLPGMTRTRCVGLPAWCRAHLQPRRNRAHQLVLAPRVELLSRTRSSRPSV